MGKQWAPSAICLLIAVQHHHAHIAGCMAEHGIESATIGLSLDGTGYGTDGRIWGGEVLIGRLDSFERFAHLDYVPMPGGEAAIREPWRMALGHLHRAEFDIESPEILNLLGAKQSEARVLRRMIERGVNAPLTSSCGRLFDAVAAVILRRTHVDYEAQAAIELEGLAVSEPFETSDTYAYELELIGAAAASSRGPRMETRGMRPRTMATSSQRCRRGQFWQSLKILSGSSDLSSTVRKPYLKKKSGMRVKRQTDWMPCSSASSISAPECGRRRPGPWLRA
jgi:hydrogenase maturation factor HypF (carbamoyltransferase family)